MKKIFTLTFLLALTMSVSAQESYRKSWDFTKWSAKTVENLKAESAKGPSTGAWSDVEKKDATEPTEVSKDNCFWEVTHQGTSEGATLQANGEPIAELEGLLYTNTTDRSSVPMQEPPISGWVVRRRTTSSSPTWPREPSSRWVWSRIRTPMPVA